MDSKRNWPSELGAPPTPGAGDEIVRRHVGRAIDEGMQPAAVADLVVDAVRADRYWIFPHADFLEMAVERFHRIAEQDDPLGGRQTPGLPPQEQIVAEVIEALSRSES
jgi:hypothetical protein